MSLEFSKYHGLGNDFILIDNRETDELKVTPEQAVVMCDRHFGIGADGIIFLLAASTADTDYTMRMFNSDGSVAEMCGNGIRCLAQFITDLGAPIDESKGRQYRISTLAGVITPEILDNGQIRVDMGIPALEATSIPTTLVASQLKAIDCPLEVAGQTWQVTCVNMGNPHCVTFVEDVAAIPLETIGPMFEHHPAFPMRTNTEFIQVIAPDYLKMRVWERGAGATLACGTGACASLVAGVLTDRCQRQATVELPGGKLEIEWSELNQRLYMTGPAELVFTGKI
ncbi:MAG TPA: diaminopimelate epimerase [Oscillatoriaceae cyanobacterium M33_DOE_052]|uniref:Diaminopimelate epimerase n=1 Tax=Planktothricoides sp. SpSt-374 TaxID=2282167 RepID=A0A7C3VGL0_9CYAN|nr:diaminopimelate epimerase [Oscillatoriaceae cyanobacterium M33_DOE_052]